MPSNSVFQGDDHSDNTIHTAATGTSSTAGILVVEGTAEVASSSGGIAGGGACEGGSTRPAVTCEYCLPIRHRNRSETLT